MQCSNLEHLNEAAEESLKKVYHKGQMHSKRLAAFVNCQLNEWEKSS